MTEKSEIKKALDAALERNPTDEELRLFNFWQKIATYSFQSNPPGTAFLTQRNIILSTPNLCDNVDFVDVDGIANTGNTGVSQFRLTQFMCPPSNLVFSLPINFVATPLGAKPFFLSASHQIINNGGDVEITVSMWDPAGKPANFVAFDWRCRAVINFLIV